MPRAESSAAGGALTGVIAFWKETEKLVPGGRSSIDPVARGRGRTLSSSVEKGCPVQEVVGRIRHRVPGAGHERSAVRIPGSGKESDRAPVRRQRVVGEVGGPPGGCGDEAVADLSRRLAPSRGRRSRFSNAPSSPTVGLDLFAGPGQRQGQVDGDDAGAETGPASCGPG